MEESLPAAPADQPLNHELNSNPAAPETTAPSGKSKYKKLLYFLPLLFVPVVAIFFLQQPKDVPFVKKATQAFFLTIESPKKSIAAVNGEILVSGKTLPGSTVLAYSETDEDIIDANSDGTFQTTLLVGDEGGLVKITSISQAGEEKSETFEVTEAVLGVKNSSQGQGKAKKDDPSDEVKVQNEKSNNREENQSKQNQKTVVNGKQNSTSSQLKIGQNPSKIKKLGADKFKEVLQKGRNGSSSAELGKGIKKMQATLASKGATLKRHAVSGVITAVSGGSITIAHQIQRDRVYTIFYDATTLITSKNSTAGGLLVGMRVAAVGEPVEGGIFAKRIHVIPGKAKGVFSKNPVASNGAELKVSPSPVSSTSAPTVTPTDVTPTIILSPTPTTGL